MGIILDKQSKEFGVIYEAIKSKINEEKVDDEKIKQIAESVLVNSK